MAKCHMRLLGLINLCSFLTGASGVDDIHVFYSSSENVHLPCNNALSDCASTTWIYNRHSEVVELVAIGIKKKDMERLSVGSDCSLNINKVTKEDYGSYSCRQYVNGEQQGTDARIHLHVLHVSVSSSSSQTEIRPGSSVTLFCQLHYDEVSCDTLVRTEGVQLIWVNQAGVSVMTDSRYQISFSSGQCISTLTTTLLNEDHNRGWRCQVKQRNELKTTVTYTVKFSGPSTTNTSESHKQVTVIVISAVAVALAVALVAVLWVICKKRADNERGTDSSVVKDRNEHKGTYETINMSIPTMSNANEQTDDVTYSEVTTSTKKQVQMDYNHSNHTVTYAAIRGTEYAPQDGLYASVNKTTTPHK